MRRQDAMRLAAVLLVVATGEAIVSGRAADATAGEAAGSPAGQAAGVGRREKPIVLPAIDATTLVSVRLDADVHAAAADGYGDLRVLDGKGSEVPSIVRHVTTTSRGTEQRRARGVVAAAKPLPDGSLEMTVTLGSGHGDARPEGFGLLTPLRDFEHRVTVAWSAARDDWVPLVDEALIYDYARFLDIRDTTLSLPPAAAGRKGGRYRIVIGDVTPEQRSRLTELTRTLAAGAEREVRERTVVERRPFRIDGIEFWYTVEVEKGEAAVLEDRAVGFRVARETGDRATRITVDVRRQPVSEFTIVTDSRNFSRTLTVERPIEPDRDGTRGRGGRIGAATITRIDVAGLGREQLVVPLPESRLESYDLVIDDGDSPPIAVAGVTARGPAREIVFLAEPGQPCRLAYGGGLAAPRYDTAAIRAALAARAAATQATLGPESAVATPAAAPDPFRLLGDGRFQIAVIAVLALILAGALFRAAKRIDAAPPSREEASP